MEVGNYVQVTNQEEESSITLYNGKYGEIIEILESGVYQYDIRVAFKDAATGEVSECSFMKSELTLVDELKDNDFSDALRQVDAEEIDTGEISDGYHTFNELYHHRTKLFAIVCNAFPSASWKSLLHFDGTMYDGYFIAGVVTPEGDYSYHAKLEYWDDYQIPELQNAPEWDGHEPSDIDRLFSLGNIEDVE